MIYIQTDISIESIKVGGTVAKGVARKLILTNNSLHTASTAYVRDINDDPYLYELMPIDGLGFDFADYLPGEYTLAVIGEEDEVLVENILVLRTVDNMEIFYDEEYPSEVIDQIPVISLEILDTINGEIIGVGYTDKTQAILESVLAIKAAIEEKGEEVGDDPLRTYADHIKKIETSSPATITIKQGDNEQSFQLNQKNDQIIEIEEGGNEPLIVYEESSSYGGEYNEHNKEVFNQLKDYFDSPDGKPFPVVVFIDSDKKPYIITKYTYYTNSFALAFQWITNYNGTCSLYDTGRAFRSSEKIANSNKITIKQGDNEQSFTLNQGFDQIIEIEEGVTDWDDIQNKPDFKPVATSGDYNDLDNKPVIGNGKITIKQGDNEQTFTLNQEGDQVIEIEEGVTDWDDIQNKPDFKPVATTGDYNDLDNKPVIEPVYNPFITIMQGGEEKGKFRLNQSNNQTIEIDEGSGDPHWFGTQAEYDAIEVKDPDTIYHIEGGSDGVTHWFGTQAEYDAIEKKDPSTIYCIEGGESEVPTFYLRPDGDGSDEEAMAYNREVFQKAKELSENDKPFEFAFTDNHSAFTSVEIHPMSEPYWDEEGELRWKLVGFQFNNIADGNYHVWVLRESGSFGWANMEQIVSHNPTITIKQGEKEQSFTLNQNTDVTIDLEAGGGSDALILHAQAGVDPNLNKPAVDEIVRILSSDEPMPLVYVKAYGIYYGAVKIDLGREDIGVTTFSGVWERREVFLFDGTYRGIQNTKLAEAKDIKDSKVTIKQGDKEQSFTLNQDTDTTIELDAGGSTTWDDIQNKPEFKPVATSGDYNDLENKPNIPSIEGLASEEYVGNELKKYLPLVGGTLTGHLTIGSTTETAYKKFEAIRKVNNEGNGAAFYVNSDGTAAFYHKSYNASGSAINDAILKFDSTGLMFATGGNRTTSATEFKKVLLEGDIPATPEPKYMDFTWPEDTESEEIDQEFAQELWDNRDKYSSGVYRIRIVNDPLMPVVADFFVTEEDPFQEICITAKVDQVMMSMILTKNSETWVIMDNEIMDVVSPRIIQYKFPGFTSGTVPASLYIAEFWNQKTQIEKGRVIIRGGAESLGWPMTFSKIAWFEDEEERQLVIEGSSMFSANTVSVTYQQFADKDPSKDDWQVNVVQHSVMHHSEKWTFELEDGSTVTKNIWTD